MVRISSPNVLEETVLRSIGAEKKDQAIRQRELYPRYQSAMQNDFDAPKNRSTRPGRRLVPCFASVFAKCVFFPQTEDVFRQVVLHPAKSVRPSNSVSINWLHFFRESF